MKTIRFSNTSAEEIGVNDSSRYPPNECHQECPLQYQVDSAFSYYIPSYNHLESTINDTETHQNLSEPEMNVQNKQISSENLETVIQPKLNVLETKEQIIQMNRLLSH